MVCRAEPQKPDRSPRQIKGSCHCRNISFTLICQAADREMPARACTCSFCTKHGAVWATLSSAALKVRVKEPAHHAKYAFATKTAQFHICSRCGVVPLVTSDIEGRVYAAVNTNTFDDVDSVQLQHASVSFEGESEAARLARRTRNWIAHVEFSEDSDQSASGQ
ncbi:GFA family protein [Dechloromonas denitrificans]|uniref:GFA family protein n=1 Tax=Dechloromonas denitrificans TaxID=281362 RepID=UPI001CF9192A|nr:hypothetical protein [Dechloromonas denitrificans]UCV02649.1 GFA family protein [Dechloromonas denitrificans]